MAPVFCLKVVGAFHSKGVSLVCSFSGLLVYWVVGVLGCWFIGLVGRSVRGDNVTLLGCACCSGKRSWILYLTDRTYVWYNCGSM